MRTRRISSSDDGELRTTLVRDYGRPMRRGLIRSSGMALALAATAMCAWPSAARAQDADTPAIMQEPGEVTDVIDAFDDANGDPYDFSFRLEFQYLAKKARILREASALEPGLTSGGFTSKLLNVGNYTETTSRLTPRADFGIYKDLAFYFKVPIVLSNSRKIDAIDDADGGTNPLALAGAPGEQLFGLPFEAPDRSGVEYLGLGLDYAIFNQARDRTKPTWVFGLETRISVGTPMHACQKGADVECTHPGDVNRNGGFDEDVTGADNVELESLEANDERGAGVTRGTVGLEFHSYMSKRLKYIEPYGGFRALFEFAMGNSDYGATDLEGALVNHPPIVGTVFVGIMIHPWEDRENYNRLTFDAGFAGEYHSEGRDYGELFDAIGSSAAPSLRNPLWSRYTADGCSIQSCVDLGSEKVYNSGLTVVEPYGSYRLHGSATFRAHEYVKFGAGLGLRFDQAHGISHDQPCNPDFQDDLGASGPCNNSLGDNQFVATGVPNPAYRRTINSVGRRFFVDNSITYEVFAHGTLMF
jgi:hypothetical protein